MHSAHLHTLAPQMEVANSVRWCGSGGEKKRCSQSVSQSSRPRIAATTAAAAAFLLAASAAAAAFGPAKAHLPELARLRPM
eukprot:COSAG01_NODE_160_length_23692_cov_9.703599_22_plen_81_part_00